MDTLPMAAALTRTLLALARSGATGVLEVREGQKRARLAVAKGTPVAVAVEPWDGDAVGDRLTALGQFNVSAHARALNEVPQAEPVGQWLIAQGVVTRPALEHALRLQLRHRVWVLYAWPEAELSFHEGSTDVGMLPLTEPIRTADLVVGALREVVREVPLARVASILGEGRRTLTATGQMLLEDAPLWPAEAAMVRLLKEGTKVEDIVLAVGGHGRAVRFLYALQVVGAVKPASTLGSPYALLLRKQRQLRRGVQPGVLLGLPSHPEPADVRRALRKLAQKVHPDRFGEHEAPEVRQASREVMSGLVDAGQRLLAG